jgi:predicted secreted Zn-dependent protease
MISLFMALSALTAQASAAPAATVPHTLQNLPGTTVQYCDVAGNDAGAIKSSLDKILKAPAPNAAAQVYNWSLQVGINKRTEGTTCTVTTAKAALKASVDLPRLAQGNRAPHDVVESFNAYEKGLEKMANDNLWFVVDRLPAIEQSLVGKPCDSVANLWNQATTNLVKEQNAFASQQAAHLKGQKPQSGDNERPSIGAPGSQAPTSSY